MTPDVFAPASLGPVQLRNRIVKAATFEGRTPYGVVSPELIDLHRTLGEGGVGLTTLAYCAVAPEGRTHAEQLVVGPGTREGLTRLTEAVHATGAKVAAQVGHAGPVANGRSNGAPAIAASAMPSPLSMQMIRSATEADLSRVTKAYVEAARTLVECGFDVLELHMAHNYLISSFLAPQLNRRKDRWGGSLENRARLARQVARAVRDEVGDAVAVTAKTSLSDGYRGGFDTEEALVFAQMLEADGNLDALQLSGGSSLMNPMYLFRGGAPVKEFAANMPFAVKWGMRAVGKGFLKSYPFEEAYFREKALRFREGLSMPLMLLGGINRRETMEQAMADGFEYVAMARALVHEPAIVNRLAAREVAGGACLHCNRCMPTIYAVGGVYCPPQLEGSAPLATV
ncbi:NADH:flavin oxidoreductase [Nocardioides dubius]|uniref:NADH:flavin oxidoreductase n=1 Tax=Nocardioides dubius TaxID=317019 RepID=A0ABN1TZY1_9ACTN